MSHFRDGGTCQQQLRFVQSDSRGRHTPRARTKLHLKSGQISKKTRAELTAFYCEGAVFVLRWGFKDTRDCVIRG